MRISAGGGKDSSLFIDKFRINVSSAAANSSVAAISKFYGRTDSTEAAYHNVRSEERSFPISTSKTRGYSSAASAEVVPPTPGLQTGVLRTFTGTSADVPGEFWNQLNPPALRRQTHRGPFNDPLLSPRNRARNIGEVDEERKETADAELERVRIKRKATRRRRGGLAQLRTRFFRLKQVNDEWLVYGTRSAQFSAQLLVMGLSATSSVQRGIRPSSQAALDSLYSRGASRFQTESRAEASVQAVLAGNIPSLVKTLPPTSQRKPFSAPQNSLSALASLDTGIPASAFASAFASAQFWQKRPEPETIIRDRSRGSGSLSERGTAATRSNIGAQMKVGLLTPKEQFAMLAAQRKKGEAQEKRKRELRAVRVAQGDAPVDEALATKEFPAWKALRTPVVMAVARAALDQGIGVGIRKVFTEDMGVVLPSQPDMNSKSSSTTKSKADFTMPGIEDRSLESVANIRTVGSRTLQPGGAEHDVTDAEYSDHASESAKEKASPGADASEAAPNSTIYTTGHNINANNRDADWKQVKEQVARGLVGPEEEAVLMPVFRSMGMRAGVKGTSAREPGPGSTKGSPRASRGSGRPLTSEGPFPETLGFFDTMLRLEGLSRKAAAAAAAVEVGRVREKAHQTHVMRPETELDLKIETRTRDPSDVAGFAEEAGTWANGSFQEFIGNQTAEGKLSLAHLKVWAQKVNVKLSLDEVHAMMREADREKVLGPFRTMINREFEVDCPDNTMDLEEFEVLVSAMVRHGFGTWPFAKLAVGLHDAFLGTSEGLLRRRLLQMLKTCIKPESDVFSLPNHHAHDQASAQTAAVRDGSSAHPVRQSGILGSAKSRPSSSASADNTSDQLTDSRMDATLNPMHRARRLLPAAADNAESREVAISMLVPALTRLLGPRLNALDLEALSRMVAGLPVSQNCLGQDPPVLATYTEWAVFVADKVMPQLQSMGTTHAGDARPSLDGTKPRSGPAFHQEQRAKLLGGGGAIRAGAWAMALREEDIPLSKIICNSERAVAHKRLAAKMSYQWSNRSIISGFKTWAANVASQKAERHAREEAVQDAMRGSWKARFLAAPPPRGRQPIPHNLSQDLVRSLAEKTEPSLVRQPCAPVCIFGKR